MANIRFAVALQRFVPFLGYHHVLMLVTMAGIILTSILLAGCSSYSTMVTIYLLGLSYTSSPPSNLSPTTQTLYNTLSTFRGTTQLEVRAGYFGLCVRQRGVIWICSSDAAGLTQQIGAENDPLNLIGLAAQFKDDVVFSGLLFIAVVLSFFCFLLLATFPGWHEEHDAATGSDVDVKPFPSRPVSQVACSCAFVAAMLSLISILWQHVGAVGAAAMAESANYGNVKAVIGAGAMAMGWITFTLIMLVFIGLTVMILSIAILDRLTDD